VTSSTFSITGVSGADKTSDPLALRCFRHKPINAVALQSLRGDFVMQVNPELAAQLEGPTT
jgi:hypothetical protein